MSSLRERKGGEVEPADAPHTPQRGGATDVDSEGPESAPASPAPPPRPGPAQSRLQKMAIRTVTAFALMGGGLAVVKSAGHLGWCGMIVAVQIFVFRELVNLRYIAAKERGIPLFRTLQWIWFVTAMLWSYTRSWLKAPMGLFGFLESVREVSRESKYVTDEWAVVDALNFTGYSIAFVTTVLCFRKGLYSYQLKQLSWTFLTLCFVVMQLKCIVYTAYAGLIWSMFPVSMIVMNDTAAYFVGQAFGKKLISAPFLELSPNKTWEGFIGAGICTVTYAYASTHIWAQFGMLRCPFPEVQAASGSGQHLTMGACQNDHLFEPRQDGGIYPAQAIFMGLAVFASTIAPFGGFAASATKRAFKIKDFDSLIPGHGGFTDRMDCQFIMGMAAWVAYTTFVSHPHHEIPLERIIWAAGQLSPADKQTLVDQVTAMIANAGA